MSEPTKLPVTPSQRNLLFLQEAVPRKDLYNISFRIVFDGPVDRAALRVALDRLLLLQPTLRTRFELSSGSPLAVVTPPGGAPLDVVEYTGPADGWQSWLETHSRAFAAEAIDLRSAPLCGFRLLTRPEGSVLLCNVHHAISDGVSMEVLLDEVFTGYRAAVLGDADDHSDQVPRREQWLRAELGAQSAASRQSVESGAVKELATALARVPATTLYPVPGRPADTRYRGELLRIVLPGRERFALEQVAKELVTTPYCVLLACYALLLGDYAGNDEVIVGTPFSARRTVASHQLCGFFVNTLPLVLPARDQSFDAHCGAVTEAVRQGKRYQSVPFDALVAELGPERASNRNPVFQCMFAMQDALRTRRELVPGVEGEVQFVHNGTSKFDLWLGATPVDDGLELELEYDADLLPASYAQRFLDEFRLLVSRAVAKPSATRRELLSALPTRERAVLRQGHRAETTADGGLLGLVREAALRTPDAVAVSEPAAPPLTYARLVERAAHAAAGLRAHGVRRGDTVGIAPDSLTETVVATLAILWCGAAYLPIDTALPQDRLAYMLERSGCRMLVSRRPVLPGEPTRDTVERLEVKGRATEGGGQPPMPAGTDPVYIMFTSGSTGLPKGVRMGQAPLVNLLRWQVDALSMGPETRFLQFAPLGFDVSYQEIFPTLACGGTVLGLGETDRRDLDGVVALVAREELTHVYLPVAVLGAFAGAVLEAGHPLPALRHVCVSGEQLHLDSRAERLLRQSAEREVVNLYGPTETHAVTTFTLRGGDRAHASHVPIGRPVAGVDAHVLGTDGHPVPPGAAGELLLGGVCTADGYVNDEERTAKAFLRLDTVGPRPERVYRTGDLVVLTEEDELVFLGRRDSQVKVRGHRVELGEIETVAERLSTVSAAAAAVHGTGEDAALALFVTPAPGARPDEAELRGALERALPGYMTPRHIMAVETVPLTPNGKVDRTALLRGFDAGAFERVSAGRHAPSWEPTETERRVRDLWEELLGCRPASPEESFFALGGNSFEVLTFVGRMEQVTGWRVPVGDFFRNPTIRALAALFDDRAAATADARTQAPSVRSTR